MAEIAFSNKQHSPTIYKEIIHPQLKNKLRLGETDKAALDAEVREAQFLEGCFNAVKNRMLKMESSMSGDLQNTVNAFLTDTMVQDLKKHKAFTYFGRTFKGGATNAGEKFEYDIARIIANILQSAGVEDSVDELVNAMWTGKNQATINRNFTQ